MRVARSFQDFDFGEQVFCGGLVQSLLRNNFHCHHFTAVPLQHHNALRHFHSLHVCQAFIPS